jgi:alpha-1,2-mannosyltransferase
MGQVMQRRFLVLLVLGTAVAAGVAAHWWHFLDLTVYRYGGTTVLDRAPLYADRWGELPFTYPPVTALAFTLVALVPLPVAVAGWTAVSVLALVGTIATFAHALRRSLTPAALAALAAGALLLDPVRATLLLGQVNLALMALVSIDLLLLRGRWSGVLVGIAAGIKLTPLVFVVLLVLVGRRAAALRAVASFAATVLVGVLVVPTDAATYWTSVMWRAGRVGDLEYVGNQSLLGTMTRLLGHEPSTALWLGLAVPVGAALMLVARAWWLRGGRDVAVLVTAGAMLLCSPISWDHHAVWCAPALLVLWHRAPRWVLVPVGLLLAVGTWPLVPHQYGAEFGWNALQQVWGNGYTWAVLALCATAVVGLRPGYSSRPRPRSVSSGSAAEVAAYEVSHRRAPASWSSSGS